VSGYLGFPQPVPAAAAPVYHTGPSSPFDIAGISKAIDDATATLKAHERGALTVKVDQDGAGAGLVVRLPRVGPFDPKALFTVTKPNAGSIGWSASARIGFLVGSAGGNRPAGEPSRFLPNFRGLYRLLRLRGCGPVDASLKALALIGGEEVRLGSSWA